MTSKCVLLLGLCTTLCRAQLATTYDGRQILLPTFWRLAGETDEPQHFGIYRNAGNRWTPVISSQDGPTLSRPFLNSDGSVVAWDRALPCTGSCLLAIPRSVTQVQGATLPPSIGTYNLIFSPNARFVLSPGFLGLVDFVLLDLATGSQWTPPVAPTLRALDVANDGSVIGLLATRDGTLTNPVVPNRVVVWRPGGENHEIFQAASVRNAWIAADGAHALIETAESGEQQRRELWWVDIAAQNRQRIAQLAFDGTANFFDPANPRISDDGSRVLYLWPSQNNTVWIWQSAAEPRELAAAAEGFASAVLSGDGRIAWALTATGRLLRIVVDTNSIEEVLPALPPRLTSGYAGTAPGSAMVWRTGGGTSPGLHFVAGSLTFPVIDDTTRDSVTIQIPWEASGGATPLVVKRDGDPFELALPIDVETVIRPVIAGSVDARGTYWIKAAQQDFGSLVAPDHPAPAGSTIHTWFYNLGPLDRFVPTGAPGPNDPPAMPTAHVGCFLLTAPATPGRPVEMPFLAYAAGLVGVYQADLTVPPNFPAGNAILICDSNGAATSAWLPVGPAQ